MSVPVQTAANAASTSHPPEAASVPAEAKPPAQFTSEGKWQTAGYNLEEIIYTISITSQDTRILRCRTQVEGRYDDHGKSAVITDQQISTVFPNQQVQVGTWTGLDQKQGATYKVACQAR
jgi:hypothetical protein